MSHSLRFLPGGLLFVSSLLVLNPARGQGQAQPRVVEAVDNARRVTLPGNVHPLARGEFDRGAASESLPMTRMLLLLKRSDEQEAALQDYLEKQQDKSSPNYHQWLTPVEFGAQYGSADVDIQSVTQWLAGQGFTVEKVYSGKTAIEFSGTAAQVRAAFGTEIRQYEVEGKAYTANASDPQIPAALAPVVAGVVSLHNFPRRSMTHVAGVFSRSKETGQVKLVEPANPELTYQCGMNSNTGQPLYCNALGPYDFATIYNVLPLWNATPAIDGAGQTIAIVGESNISVQDVRSFRTMFGLQPNDPVVVLNGPDPGLVQGAETEADLDVEWSGAVAKGATIKLVASQSTETTSGADLSAAYTVDNNLAPIMSMSFGNCELYLGTAGNRFFNNLWEQAAAQGISVFVASGDNGSAGCDFFRGNVPQTATNGLQVSGIASTPFNVAVGGTDFNDIFTESTYWTTTNDPTTQKSALSYIPETAWNDSCTNAIFGDSRIGFSTNSETNCNNSQLVNWVFTVGGSGGRSSCTTPSGQSVSNCAGGYAKPAWQIGTGVPVDGRRDVPDVSLFAGDGFAGNVYAVCELDVGYGSCSYETFFLGVGGTSASAPALAGIMALVNQKSQSQQGNPNYVLYKLAAKQSAASCNSSTGPASTCVFNDVTSGTNAMPCTKGSLNCTTSNSNDQYGILSGYSTGTGYDLATGLGSVNAQNLVNDWSSITFLTSATTLNASVNGSPVSSISVAHGATVGVTSDVSAGTGATGTPTGQVALMATPNPTPNLASGNPGASLGIEALALSNGSASDSGVILPGGTYNLTAHYQGDGSFKGSDSSPISVSIAAESSKTLVSIPLFDPNTGRETGNTPTTLVYGSPYIARIDVGNAQATLPYPPKPVCTPPSCPTGTITWTDAVNGGATTPLDGGTFALNSEGFTEDQTIQLSGGSHGLTATYSGDNSYQQSSGMYSLTVTPATMQLSLGVPTSTVIGVPFTVYMTGTTSVVAAAPMGTLSLYDGTTLLLSVTGSGLGGYGGTRSGSGPTATAGFAIDTGILLSTLGSRSLTMTYSGDPNYSAAPTSPQVVRVVYPTTMALQPSATTANWGSSITLTATLNTAQASPAITGQITFTSSSGQQTIAAGPTTQTVINGFTALQATATVTMQSSDWLIASYSGDSNYAATSATSPYITVNNPDFNVVPAQPGLTITAGQSAGLAITVTLAYPLSAPVQFQVPSPVVQGISCSISPTQIQASGGNSATATLTCSVPAPSSSNSTTQIFPLRWPKLGPRNIWWKMSGLLAALALACWLLPVRLRLRRLAYACLLLGTVSFALGCGGGSGGGGGGGGGAAPTSTTLTVASTKVSAANLGATVEVTGTNSPTGSVNFGVVGESWSFNTAALVNGTAQFSYYLGAPGAFLMTAQYSGDSRNLPSQIHTPLTVVQTGVAGSVTVNATIGPTTRQTSVTLTVQ